jgi:hypothetical protein
MIGDEMKKDSGKLRHDLLYMPALIEIVTVHTKGAEKYAPRKWEEGMEWGRMYGALQRHATAFWSGESRDPEWGLHHLAHAATCCMMLMGLEANHPDKDDRSRLV